LHGELRGMVSIFRENVFFCELLFYLAVDMCLEPTICGTRLESGLESL
jgi:hypothetical protein